MWLTRIFRNWKFKGIDKQVIFVIKEVNYRMLECFASNSLAFTFKFYYCHQNLSSSTSRVPY